MFKRVKVMEMVFYYVVEIRVKLNGGLAMEYLI
jgi:hypothetical protein